MPEMDVTINMRVKPSDLHLIDLAAEQLDITRSELIRRAAMEKVKKVLDDTGYPMVIPASQ